MTNELIAGVEDKYPAPLLKGRDSVEGNVLACFFHDPLLLDETKCKKEDFITESGRFYFQLLNYFRQKGLNTITEVDIRALEDSKPDVAEKFKDFGDMEVVEHMVEVVNPQNFEAYIDTLFKENILLKLHDDGFNLLEPIKTDDGKQRIPLKILRKMNAEGVIDWWESRLSTYGDGYSKRIIEEEMIDFSDEFFVNCAEGANNGIPFESAGKDTNGRDIRVYPFLSRQIGGLLPGTLSMIGGFSSSGKSTWLVGMIMALLNAEQKIILISNEEQIKQYKNKLLVWLMSKYDRYNLSKKRLMSGELTDEDRAEYKKIQEYWRANYKDKFKIVRMNDADMLTAKKKIREAALRDGFTVFIYDTFKIQESDYDKSRTDLSLVKDSRELDKIAKKYNMIGLASVQLAEYQRGTLFLSAQQLSNAKQIKEILENLWLIRTVYAEEIDSKNKKYYCNPFRIEKKDDKWVETPFSPDEKSVWRVLFVEKCRSGANSSDTGRAYLLQCDLDYAIFRETAQCKPRHGQIV